jgi:hypothetical protein
MELMNVGEWPVVTSESGKSLIPDGTTINGADRMGLGHPSDLAHLVDHRS